MVSYEVKFFIADGNESRLENDGIFIKIFGRQSDSGMRRLRCLRKRGATDDDQDGVVRIQNYLFPYLFVYSFQTLTVCILYEILCDIVFTYK